MTSPPTSVVAGLTAGDHEIGLVHEDIERRYFIHIPTDLKDGPVPLVIALHGGGGTAAQLKSEIGLDDLADREGFVAVYPDGTGNLDDLLHTWNAGFNCCGPAERDNVDDVGFVRAVVADVAQQVRIDPGRVAVTGHSNGAIMAYRVAAEAGDVVSVAVPVAGAMALDPFEPARPVAILHIHSSDDPRALYDGGEGPPFPGMNSTVLHEPVVDGLEAWAATNGCGGPPTEIETATDGDQSVTRLEYSECDPVAPVVHLRLEGVGHGWPGVEARIALGELLGPSTTLIDATEEMWEFAQGVWTN